MDTKKDFGMLVAEDSIQKTMDALKENNFMPMEVNTKEEALTKIKEIIPDGASVMNGASETLREIGYIDLLKNKDHKWRNLHDTILAETDSNKQAELRKQSVLSDFYLGSAHSITETGEIVVASNSGSQLPHLAFTSPNIILVVGTHKITKDLKEAFQRIDQYVVPLEDVRMKGVYGYGTLHAKTLILHKENPAIGRKVHIIFVKEKLGY